MSFWSHKLRGAHKDRVLDLIRAGKTPREILEAEPTFAPFAQSIAGLWRIRKYGSPLAGTPAGIAGIPRVSSPPPFRIAIEEVSAGGGSGACVIRIERAGNGWIVRAADRTLVATRPGVLQAAVATVVAGWLSATRKPAEKGPGRPRVPLDLPTLAAYHAKGYCVRKISRLMGVSKSTVATALARVSGGTRG